MTNRFYGFNNLESFVTGIGELRKDLHELVTTDVKENEVLEYCILLLKAQYGRGLWAYDDPNNMPADCRVAYVYTPTYLATAILMYSWMHYEKVRSFSDLEVLLKDAMIASTGREFMGAGYEAEEGFEDAMRIFEEAHADEFVDRYPQFCPEFTSLYKYALERYKSKKTNRV